MTATKLSNDLRADGFQITAAGAQRGTAGGTLYLGYELPKNFAVEVAGTYIGRTRAILEGVSPADLSALLSDTAHIVRGSGDIVALEGRYRWPLVHAIDLDLRAGPYCWLTTSDVYVSGVDKLHRSDSGLGYTLGVGPRFALTEHVGIGVSAEYFNSTSQNQFWLFSATLEYHF
jgi:opacity protein-like surface antigen